jgi:hypothetical protein
MTKPRKILIAFLLVLSVVVPAWSTGYPVIDVSAIMNAIAEFSTTVQQYQKQIMQWKSEYDRLAKAAQSIAKGDFDSVLRGISQAATAISGYGADLAFFAEVSAAAETGRKLVSDGKQMANSVESTWSRFLNKVNAADSTEDAIDLLWDMVSLSPVADSYFAASDYLTSDFLNNSYVKKLQGDEWREKVYADNEEAINEMTSNLASTIKSKDDAAQTLKTAEESLKKAEASLNSARDAEVAAASELSQKQADLQSSIASDGEVESNRTRELRAAVEAATVALESARNNHEKMQAAYESQKTAYKLAEERYDQLNNMANAQKSNLDQYIQDLTRQAEHTKSAQEELEKSNKAYNDIQNQRLAAYEAAHTYTALPSSIPQEALSSESKMRYYIKNGTLAGYVDNEGGSAN